jgi:hypothetical protein
MDPADLIDELIAREGGYVAQPADKGGPTRYGISRAVARAHGYAGDMAALPVPMLAPVSNNSAATFGASAAIRSRPGLVQ